MRPFVRDVEPAMQLVHQGPSVSGTLRRNKSSPRLKKSVDPPTLPTPSREEGEGGGILSTGVRSSELLEGRYHFSALKKTSNPPSSPFVKRGKTLLLPLEKGGGEGFNKFFSYS